MRALLCVICVLYFAILVEPQNSHNCKDNETFTDCQTCEKKCGGDIYECSNKCVPGCTCDRNYARDRETGKCIKHSDCPCPENEIFDGCTSHCSPRCEDPHGYFPCTRVCKPGCACVRGYARNKNYNCVKFSDCPGYQNCSIANEVYRSCQIYCGETCQHPQVVNDECLKRTCQRGCFCKFNFLRDELTGKCVPEKDCDGA